VVALIIVVAAVVVVVVERISVVVDDLKATDSSGVELTAVLIYVAAVAISHSDLTAPAVVEII
jgi:hypothetical protein